jgi:hypothetical protein
MLSLKDAMKNGKLADFIRQEEERGVLAIDKSDFDAVLSNIVKPKQSKGQTSHSPSRDGSRGK